VAKLEQSYIYIFDLSQNYLFVFCGGKNRLTERGLRWCCPGQERLEGSPI